MKELEKHITEYLDDNLMEGYGQILEILEKALEKDEKDIRHDLERYNKGGNTMKNMNDKFEALISELQDEIVQIDQKKDEISICRSSTVRAILSCVMEMQKIYNEGC
jgi:SMC interacting uncharacterized protein involved in chromosome segregation